MIENREYTSPTYGVDEQGRHRSWPLPFGPQDPEHRLPIWAAEISNDPWPRLVHPAPLVDPALMEVIGDAG